MAILLDCANEILIDIFKFSSDIDSLVRLASCNRRLHRLFDSHHLEITKHVVLHSKAHRYDVALCYFTDAFHAFSSEQLHSHHGEIDSGVYPSHTRFEEYLKADDLSSRQVLDILARWQGLKLVRNLYMNCAVHHYYIERPCTTGDNHLTEQPILDILRLRSLPHGSLGINCDGCSSLKMNDAVSERFYTALTKYWLAIECLRFADICRYERQSEQNEVYDQIRDLWYQYGCFQESLETLEVYDFVYGYLAGNIQLSSIATFGGWIQGEDADPATFPQNVEENWSYFMQSLRLALTPADVLDLLALSSLWKREPSKEWAPERKTQYLRTRGYFHHGFPGQVSLRDVGESPDVWFSVSDLEEACSEQIQTLTKDISGASEAWNQYRLEKWQTSARGNFGSLSAVVCQGLLHYGVLLGPLSSL